jgi:hypothetical protein
MAWTFNAACNAAALNGLTALFNSGRIALESSAPADLAVVSFGATAFGSGTSASPSVASANTTTPATSGITAGTIAFIDFRTSGGSSRIRGTVGTSGADFIVTSAEIPSGTTEVDVTGLQFTLQLAGA